MVQASSSEQVGGKPDLKFETSDLRSEEYRSVSGWAVAALLLGLLSAAAIVGPILWLIPAAGLVTAVVAMRKIKTAQGQKTGWYLALLGLLLSIFFAAAGPARTMSRNLWLQTRGERFARGFVDLLRNNQPLKALELTKPGPRKPLPANPLESLEKNPEAKKSYDRFLDNELVKALLEWGQNARLEEFSPRFLDSDERHDYVAVHYRIASGEKTPVSGDLYLERTVESLTGTEQWRLLPLADHKVE